MGNTRPLVVEGAGHMHRATGTHSMCVSTPGVGARAARIPGDEAVPKSRVEAGSGIRRGQQKLALCRAGDPGRRRIGGCGRGKRDQEKNVCSHLRATNLVCFSGLHFRICLKFIRRSRSNRRRKFLVEQPWEPFPPCPRWGRSRRDAPADEPFSCRLSIEQYCETNPSQVPVTNNA